MSVNHEKLGYSDTNLGRFPYSSEPVVASLPAQATFSINKANIVACQGEAAFYSLDTPRVLWNPNSKKGQWISGGRYSNEYSEANLNSDIIEKKYRTQKGSKEATLTCLLDKPAYVDTLAILGHNLTTEAKIKVEGYNDSAFKMIGGYSNKFEIEPTKKNTIYISKYLPGRDYSNWKITIIDPTNPGEIEIGSIFFGESTIFKTNIREQLRIKKTEYKDSFRTEGFTSVANSRAVKRSVEATFTGIDYVSYDYQKLDAILEYARTSKKCLWVFDPKNPQRFYAYGKLKRLPEEAHRVGGEYDKIAISLEVDESL